MLDTLESIIYSMLSTGFQKDVKSILLTNKSFYNNPFLWNKIINKPIQNNTTLLMSYAINNKYDRFKFLLDCGADINMVDNNNYNVLIYALCGNDKNTIHKCESCNLKIIEDILNSRQEIKNIEKSIYFAIQMKYIEAIKLICNYDFNINYNYEKYGTPMIFAIDRNNAEICYELWKKGADINSVDSKYHTFLMTAIYNNMNYEIIEEILKKKPNINALDIHGCSALNYAIFNENIKIIKLLIAYKADINSINIRGESCLMYAIIKKNVEIINILCDNKVNINYRNLGLDAIKYANKLQYYDIEKLLKKHLKR
jgi:ankyrin repeat protein